MRIKFNHSKTLCLTLPQILEKSWFMMLLKVKIMIKVKLLNLESSSSPVSTVVVRKCW